MNKLFLGILTIFASFSLALGQTEREPRSAPLAEKQGRSISLASGTAISAELQKTLDINNARVGDQVILKTSQSIKQNGEVVVPRGSNLIGRITEVQRRTRENGQSRVAMIFDRIEGKQLSIPVNATLTGITNNAASARAADILGADGAASTETTTSTSRSSSGGGLLGGLTNTAGGLVSTTTQTVGGVANTAGTTVGNTAGAVGRTVNGIQISADASGSSTTTLSSPNRNLRVEKGATFHLRVAN